MSRGRLWYGTFKDHLSTPQLFWFPLGAGFVWFWTLTILLIRWLAIGMPTYPDQANPDVPFISDIGAQVFKPVFVAGCALTGFCFFGTVFAVHHVRYSPRFYGLVDDAPWRQVLSLISLTFGLAAAVALFMLSVFDTVEETVKHRFLLMGTFCGLFVSGVTTTIVWWDQTAGPRVFVGLRKWCFLNNFLVTCIFSVVVAFGTLVLNEKYRYAGYLEWTLCYLGSFWLSSFVGFVRFREGQVAILEETRPLLA